MAIATQRPSFAEVSQRNLVERFFNQVKQFRGLATRYDRNPENYLAALKLAAVRIWLAEI